MNNLFTGLPTVYFHFIFQPTNSLLASSRLTPVSYIPNALKSKAASSFLISFSLSWQGVATVLLSFITLTAVIHLPILRD